MRMKRHLVAVVGAGILLASTAAACSSDDSASPRSSTTASTTSSALTPSTVSDADFEDQATTAEMMIRNAGGDACAVVQAFSPASSLPTPINATQTERGVRVIAELFQAAAAAAPPESAADGQVLANAANALIAEGQAASWEPNWLMQTPKAISDPAVSQAFANYQAAVAKTCGATATTAPG